MRKVLITVTFFFIVISNGFSQTINRTVIQNAIETRQELIEKKTTKIQINNHIITPSASRL